VQSAGLMSLGQDHATVLVAADATVSNNAMRQIDPMLQKSEKPVLMWIYN